MANHYTREDVADKLQKKSDEINVRLDDLKFEVERAGERLVDRMKRRPVAVAAIALLGGVLLGIILRRRGKPSLSDSQSYREFIEKYLDVIIDEAGAAVNRGEETDEAIERALRERAPLFIYAPQEAGKARKPSSTIRNLVSVLGQQFLQSVAFVVGDMLMEKQKSKHRADAQATQTAEYTRSESKNE